MAQLIASASDDLQIWEFVSHDDCKSLSKCSFSGLPMSLSWNHTNQVVAVGLHDKRIDLVQATTGQLLSTLPFSPQEGISAPVRAVKFSGNSRYLASSEGSIIQLWDLKKRALKSKLDGHKSTVVAVSFFADGTIAAGDSSGAIRIWDVKTDSSYREMNVDQPVINAATSAIGLTCMELSFSGPSRVAAGYTDGGLSLWDPVTLTQLRKQIIHKQEISSIAFSPKNPRLVATSSYDGRMTLVDTGSKSSDASASIDIGTKLTSLTFHEDAIHCAVGTANGRILFYDWRNVRKPIVTIESQSLHPIHALTFQVPKIKADAAVATPVKKTFTSFSTTTPTASPRISEGGRVVSATGRITAESTAAAATTTAAATAAAAVVEVAAAATVIIPTPVRDVPIEVSIGTAALATQSAPTVSKPSTTLPIPVTASIKQSVTGIPIISKPVDSSGSSKQRETQDEMSVDGMQRNADGAGGIGGDTVKSIFRNENNENHVNYEDDVTGGNDESERKKSSRVVTSSDLEEALQLMKYDMHKELQGLMREQVRQFAIAKEDTSKLFQELNSQLTELLLSNKELRAENDQLRRIY